MHWAEQFAIYIFFRFGLFFLFFLVLVFSLHVICKVSCESSWKLNWCLLQQEFLLSLLYVIFHPSLFNEANSLNWESKHSVGLRSPSSETESKFRPATNNVCAILLRWCVSEHLFFFSNERMMWSHCCTLKLLNIIIRCWKMKSFLEYWTMRQNRQLI